MLGKLKIVIFFCFLYSCVSYKHKIAGEWETVTIDDELLSFDSIRKINRREDASTYRYFKSGEYHMHLEDYSEYGKYIINSDTLIYITDSVMFKILKLEKKVMILQFVNRTWNDYVYLRRR